MKGQKCISGLFQCNQEFMRFSGQKEQYFGAQIYKQRKIWKISKKFPFCPEILMIKSINRPKYSRFSGQKGSSDLQSPFVLKKFREILCLYFGGEKGTLEMSKIIPDHDKSLGKWHINSGHLPGFFRTKGIMEHLPHR